MACERPAFQSILSHPVACEKAALRVYLSRVMASPSAVKGLAILANLSLFLPCDRRVFGSALPCAKHSPAFGARTGRALQNRVRTGQRQSECYPMARSLRGVYAFGQNKGYPLARAPEGPSPMALQMFCKCSVCKPFCSARPVRAPKEEQWQSTWPSASKNGAATGQVSER